MSSQKGNSNRSRAQKHKNLHVFKNNLHDTSVKTKFLNNLQINDVCERCRSILEWKIKYKKYKLLKNPKTCVKCSGKSVNLSYRTMCHPCAIKLRLCPKCGKDESSESTVDSPVTADDKTGPPLSDGENEEP